MLGAYGHPLAQTPRIDRLAEEGIRFTQAFATAAVCAPARSCLITGVYATSLGTQHLRSDVPIPDAIRPFPKYLREAGYYCTNNEKEDYSFVDSTIWDESSASAHWRKRPEGRPFFSVFNLETTHQSRIFGSDEDFAERFGERLEAIARQNPAEVAPPPYYPDSPTIRKMLARYLDLVSMMDRQVGEILDQLKADGLAANTIVFFYADHGTGLPRGKRALYDTGIRVPLIVRVPAAYRHLFGLPPGSVTDRLVSFVDFAPTVLRLAGLEVPAFMQGQAFMGAEPDPAREYVFAHADRVDEAFEVTRAVRDQGFKYIRNYLPQLPLLQPNFYTDQSEIMQELRRLQREAPLTGNQETLFRSTRAVEELYDLTADSLELNNLADDPAHQEILVRMRARHFDWVRRTHDTGLLPEAYMHEISVNQPVYYAVQDSAVFPTNLVLETTELTRAGDVEGLRARLQHAHPVVRFWAVNGLHFLDAPPGQAAGELLKDPKAFNRIAAAEWLALHGKAKAALPVLLEEIETGAPIDQLQAVRAFELLGEIADPIRPRVARVRDRLAEQTEGQYMGYDLYAYWALREAFR